jgi:uncharacterized protein YjbI with pentapeptide repeats
MNMRRSLDETWRYFEAMGWDMSRTDTGDPLLPDRMPRYDDAELIGVRFFRTFCKGDKLSDLSLSRAYFGRSSFEHVDFRGSDLSESRMCWNDFIDCDFTDADLRRCDMRASNFKGCIFRNADLSNADLRRSTFEACIFENARVTDAIAFKPAAREDLIPLLEKAQRPQIRWASELGEEPPGG